MFIGEKELRKLFQEALSNNNAFVFETENMNVNATTDPSAPKTDVNHTQSKPKDRMGLKAAISSMIDDANLDNVTATYDAISSILMNKDSGDNKMKKENKVEETVRSKVRSILSEIMPRDSWSYSGPEYGSDDEEDVVRRKNVTMTDVDGANFAQIAQELGFSVAGAKQAVDKALLKAQFVASMDKDDLEITVLQAMDDYVDYLESSGELTPEDVMLIKDHPDLVRELDGFRDYLDKYIRRARRAAGPTGE